MEMAEAAAAAAIQQQPQPPQPQQQQPQPSPAPPPNAEIVRGQVFEVGPRYTNLAYMGEGAYGMVV